ncbi:dephospho-CoA kinase [Abyssisolibacter fermentans]|uniref:dephospho-CoA kinase n=1 Tax=Abyssisolibacter fermentans TaxID=1766203 RepID=UPI00082AD301|nr:dephospho-CoA kinase [Abyssisolibacter fermentans]
MKQNNNEITLIGITGGIGTGKSTVSNILRNKGYVIIDADIIAREALEVGKPGYDDVIDYFGADIITYDKSIDRRKLGEIVFNNNDLIKKLNDIVHPHVYNEIKHLIELNSKQNNIIFLDIPLLIEEKDKLYSNGIIMDHIWLVYADRETQLNRILKRDNLGKDEAISRINSQMSIEDKRKEADVIIENKGDLKELEHQIDDKLREILSIRR